MGTANVIPIFGLSSVTYVTQEQFISSGYQYAIILRVCESADGHKEVRCGCVASWIQDRVQISNLSV